MKVIQITYKANLGYNLFRLNYSTLIDQQRKNGLKTMDLLGM